MTNVTPPKNNTPDAPPAEQEVVETIETSTPHDNIAAAYNALSSIDGIDTVMVGIEDEQMRRKIEEIEEMALHIIHHELSVIFTAIFSQYEIENDE